MIIFLIENTQIKLKQIEDFYPFFFFFFFFFFNFQFSLILIYLFTTFII